MSLAIPSKPSTERACTRPSSGPRYERHGVKHRLNDDADTLMQTDLRSSHLGATCAVIVGTGVPYRAPVQQVAAGTSITREVVFSALCRRRHSSDSYWSLFSKGHRERCAIFMLGPCSRQSRPPRFVSSELTLGEWNPFPNGL
jgi:hypothetical protein